MYSIITRTIALSLNDVLEYQYKTVDSPTWQTFGRRTVTSGDVTGNPGTGPTWGSAGSIPIDLITKANASLRLYPYTLTSEVSYFGSSNITYGGVTGFPFDISQGYYTTTPSNTFYRDDSTGTTFTYSNISLPTQPYAGAGSYANAQTVASADPDKFKFGCSSVLINNSSLADYSLGISYATTPITFECWINIPSVTNNDQNIIGTCDTAGNGMGISLLNGCPTFKWGNIRLSATDNFGTAYNLNTVLKAPSAISTNAWHHVAGVRDGNNLYLFVDGVLVDSLIGANFSPTYTWTALITLIGGALSGPFNASAPTYLTGNIDEIRISNTARYTASFTPPSQPFVGDSTTLRLFHLEAAFERSVDPISSKMDLGCGPSSIVALDMPQIRIYNATTGASCEVPTGTSPIECSPCAPSKLDSNVVCATISNEALTYSATGKSLTNTVIGVKVIDGITPVVGDLVLFKNQSNEWENGVYTVLLNDSSSYATFYKQNKVIFPYWVHVLGGATQASFKYFQTSDSVKSAPYAISTFTLTDCASSYDPPVPGPEGPQGPPGVDGTSAPHDGMNWAGEWANATDYKASNPSIPVHADVVSVDNAVYVCILDHTSSDMTRPQLSTYVGPTTWQTYWALAVEGNAGETLPIGQVSFVDSLYNGVLSWMKDATLGDWIGAVIIGTGIVTAGNAIIDSFTKDGSSPTNQDTRYNGTPSYTGAYTAPSLRSVVTSLCQEAGIASYDTSLLDNTIECHFSLSQVTSIRTILDNMSRAFQFDMVDSSGTLKFVPRSATVVRTLTHDDMGFNSSNDVVAPVTMKRLQSIDLPRKVSLTYIAEDLDYNNYTQSSEIPTFAAGNDVTLSVPFMMTHANAKEAVDKLLIGAHLERMQYTFKTSYQNTIDLEPGDVVQIPEGTVRIVQIEEVDDGILEIHCVDAGAVGDPQPIIEGGVTIGYTASTYIGSGSDAQIPAPVLNAAPNITEAGAFFIDPPVLNANDKLPRVFAAIHGYGQSGWPGAQVFKSIDGGGSYSLLGSVTESCKWGKVVAPIPDAQHFFWDDTTSITVEMKTGVLTSKTDAAVLAGDNLCMIGGEAIAFGVATLVSPGVYQLSHLLRGRNGTEYASTNHQANELFVMLDSSLFEIDVSDSDRGKTFKYKVVTIGSDLTLVDPVDVQIIGNNTLPWTAVNLNGSKTGSTWNLSWIPRSRYNNGLQDYNEVLNDYDFGGYAIIIYSGATIVRQELIYTNTYAYTLDMQTTDFGGEQNALKFGVIQISNKYGGGQQNIITV